MQLIVANLGHVLTHLVAKTEPLGGPTYTLIVAEVLEGRVMAVLDATGVPVSIGGVFANQAQGPGTCWFSVVPGVRPQGMPTVALMLRRVVRTVAPAFPDGVAAYVRDDNQQGRRLARAIGFEPGDLVTSSARQWRFGGGRSDRKASEAASGAGA